MQIKPGISFQQTFVRWAQSAPLNYFEDIFIPLTICIDQTGPCNDLLCFSDLEGVHVVIIIELIIIITATDLVGWICRESY